MITTRTRYSSSRSYTAATASSTLMQVQAGSENEMKQLMENEKTETKKKRKNNKKRKTKEGLPHSCTPRQLPLTSRDTTRIHLVRILFYEYVRSRVLGNLCDYHVRMCPIIIIKLREVTGEQKRIAAVCWRTDEEPQKDRRYSHNSDDVRIKKHKRSYATLKKQVFTNYKAHKEETNFFFLNARAVKRRQISRFSRRLR